MPEGGREAGDRKAGSREEEEGREPKDVAGGRTRPPLGFRDPVSVDFPQALLHHPPSQPVRLQCDPRSSQEELTLGCSVKVRFVLSCTSKVGRSSIVAPVPEIILLDPARLGHLPMVKTLNKK